MKRSYGHGNVLLVELLIVVAFFMLAAAFLMQMFAAARAQGEDAGLLDEVLVSAQNTAELLYAAEDPEMALAELGFVNDPDAASGIWRSESEGLVTEVQMQEEATDAGRLVTQTVRVLRDDEQLIELPVAKYEEVRP